MIEVLPAQIANSSTKVKGGGHAPVYLCYRRRVVIADTA